MSVYRVVRKLGFAKIKKTFGVYPDLTAVLSSRVFGLRNGQRIRAKTKPRCSVGAFVRLYARTQSCLFAVGADSSPKSGLVRVVRAGQKHATESFPAAGLVRDGPVISIRHGAVVD